MEYMTTREASDLWGYPESTIRKWCRDGKLFTVLKAEKKSGRWQIPTSAQCPKPIKKETEK